ncbi:MAG TPA: anti-sigma factor [Terriglobia bacterium]|nr:anti-sigma factor [Terriglobia bacterium]
MSHQEQFEQNLEGYVLGVLDAEENRAIEDHLKACPDCARKLEQARGLLALIGMAEPVTPPPARAREQLLARLRPHPQAKSRLLAHDYWRWAALGLAAATIALLFVTAGFVRRNHALDQRIADLRAEAARQEAQMERAVAVLQVLTAPDTLRVTLTAANTRPLPQGQAFYNPRKGLLFYASHLSPSPNARTYQLWLVPQQGKPISAGIFNPGPQGNAEVVLPSLPKGVKAAAFAVTIEPAGGVPQPTGPKVLIGAIS